MKTPLELSGKRSRTDDDTTGILLFAADGGRRMFFLEGGGGEDQYEDHSVSAGVSKQNILKRSVTDVTRIFCRAQNIPRVMTRNTFREREGIQQN